MDVLIASIGKWKRAPEEALYQHYIKRLRWRVELKELSGFPKHDTSQRQFKETQLLLQNADDWGADAVIILDETGKTLASQELAKKFQAMEDSGIRKVAFLIGGDVGFDKKILPKHVTTLCFGALTWPHLLIRVLLAEQLYRSYAIMTGHPYHRV